MRNILKKKPSYIGVKVCDEWKYFSNFKKWFDENYRWDLVEKDIMVELDKDLFSDDNGKIYIPDTCIFLPRKINAMMKRVKSNSTSNVNGVS